MAVQPRTNRAKHQKNAEQQIKKEIVSMSIRYIEAGRQIILETQHTSYQMKIDELGYLQHQYYGARTGQEDLSYLSYRSDRGQRHLLRHDAGLFRKS